MGGKRIPPQTAETEERYRLLVSDGKYQHSFTMLATQLNHMFINNLLTDYTIIRVENYITSLIGRENQQPKKVLVLLAIVVLNKGSEVGRKIGDPVAVDQLTGTKSSYPTSNPSMSSLNSYAAIRTAKKDVITEGHVHPINSLSPYQNK